MRDKLENLMVGYVLLMLILFLSGLILTVMPKTLFGSILFTGGVLFYPALILGKNLKKLEKWIKKQRDSGGF